MKKSFLLYLLLIPVVLYTQTIVPGGNVAGLWDKQGSPYLIQNDISILDTLTIESGVEVIFENYAMFQVFGALYANGVYSDSIVFTVSDTSGYFNNSHSGWGGLDITEGAFAEIHYTVIEFSKYAGSWVIDAEALITGSEIRFCGSGLLISSSNAYLENISINNNNGKGIEFLYGMYGNNMEISGFVIEKNAGIGIKCGNGSRISATGGVIAENLQGIKIDYESWPGFTDVDISSNGSAGNEGGGINCKGGAFFTNCEVFDNFAGFGGGLFCEPYGFEQVEMMYCTIRDNSALQSGGGLYVTNDGVVLSNSAVYGNQANLGAGIYLEEISFSLPSHFSNLTVFNNHADQNGGGVFTDYCWESLFEKTTISNNTAANSGGGVYFSGNMNGEPIQFKNSIIWDNLPEEIDGNTGGYEINYSDIQGGCSGVGNIDLEPLFLNPVDEDFRLQWINYPMNDYTKSPCIDSGDPASPTDPDGTPADMGSCYFDHNSQQQYLLQLKVFLQGAYNSGQMDTTLNNQGYIPLSQPFSSEPWDHFGSESVAEIPNPNITDWILIEMKRKNNSGNSQAFETKCRNAAFLLNDGSIVGLDGENPPEFYSDKNDSLLIKIYHRNHLPVMSSYVLNFSNQTLVYDFSQDELMVSGGKYSHSQLAPGLWGLTAGDGNADGQVDNTDKNDVWLAENEISGYKQGDFNMDSRVDTNDLNLFWNTNTGKGIDNSAIYEFREWNCGNLLYDTRNGQSYPTVAIGDQCWMAKNLNYGTMVDLSTDQTDDGVVEKYCIENLESNCDIYGANYQWGEVMLYTIDEGTQGICPEGWHIPTDMEWCELENFVDSDTIDCYSEGFRGTDAGGHLKDTTNLWTDPNTGATNLFGFNALPGGYYNYCDYQIEDEGLSGQFFTSSLTGPDNPWSRMVQNDLSTIRRKHLSGEFGKNLRCINDQ
ncbi:MAG: hypothetical protein JW731_14665 [Bacteroidales bacterium]|nr:hypothetical protein [Bacteroidales bacterium]